MTPIPVLDSSPEEIVQALRQQVRRLEGARQTADSATTSSGCEALDRLLPEGGFPRGTLVEWISAASSGCGTGTLAMIAAREAAAEGGAVVVMDRARQFYPPAAAALGVDLQHVIVIRARSEQDEIWALDQALRCAGVAAVWAPLERIDLRSFRRLQLAAESSGVLGLLLRPARVLGQPSWSHVQLLVTPKGSGVQNSILPDKQPLIGVNPLPAKLNSVRLTPATWRWRVEVVRCRNAAGGAVEVDMDEVTGAVREVSDRHATHPLHLAAQLAHPTPRRRSARA
jgi:protein ImuA